jgi:hypothetical protein
MGFDGVGQIRLVGSFDIHQLADIVGCTPDGTCILSEDPVVGCSSDDRHSLQYNMLDLTLVLGQVLAWRIICLVPPDPSCMLAACHVWLHHTSRKDPASIYRSSSYCSFAKF